MTKGSGTVRSSPLDSSISTSTGGAATTPWARWPTSTGWRARCVELIADGIHVHPSLWPLVVRMKPEGRLILVSDALAVAGSGRTRGEIGGRQVEIQGDRCVLVDGGQLAGSMIALDSAVGNLADAGLPLPAAVRAAGRNPLELLGVDDRGRIAVGQLAHLSELDDELGVLRVLRGRAWSTGAAGQA